MYNHDRSYGANHVIGSFSKYINGEMKGDHNLLHVNITYFLANKKKPFFQIWRTGTV